MWRVFYQLRGNTVDIGCVILHHALDVPSRGIGLLEGCPEWAVALVGCPTPRVELRDRSTEWYVYHVGFVHAVVFRRTAGFVFPSTRYDVRGRR